MDNKSPFMEDYDPTIEGVSLRMCILTQLKKTCLDSYQKNCVVDSIPAMIDILDTTGQEAY